MLSVDLTIEFQRWVGESCAFDPIQVGLYMCFQTTSLDAESEGR